MKKSLKGLLSLALVLLMVLSLLPTGLLSVTAYAAGSTLTGLSDESIGLSYSSYDAWTADGDRIVGEASGKNLFGTMYTSRNSTLTIKNAKATSAILSFDYAVVPNDGTIQIDGEKKTESGTYSATLTAGQTKKVYIKSSKSTKITKITLTNIKLVATGLSATTSFQPAASGGGSYTVDGKEITSATDKTQNSEVAYSVAATPLSGYKFVCWYNVTEDKYISTAATASLNIEKDCTITAIFAPTDSAVFEVGGKVFGTLDSAISYAQANQKEKITLLSDGTLTGNYTIPSGITLLIPFDTVGTLYRDTPAYVQEGKTAEAQKPFRTLTMAAGASITVNGNISVGGKHYTSSGQYCCRPVGAYGLIKMAEGSRISLNNGANLYAWGYITGSGAITANSGAKVYEYFQVTDWRGGSYTSGMADNSEKVFPFSQYYVQNIEVALTLLNGAEENTYISVTARGSTISALIPFVGDNGLFAPGDNGSLTKKYIPQEDRTVFEISGIATLNSIALEVMGMTIDSRNYVLPISNNVTINITNGTTTLTSDVALLPGVVVNIADGAELKVGKEASLYVYDQDEWSKNYVYTGGNSGYVPVLYSPSGKGTRSLADARINVAGTLTSAGSIYTTKSGANICSNSAGKYVQESAPGTGTITYQADQAKGEMCEIPITPATLRNADDSYTETAASKAGDTYVYANGKWALKGNEIAITFDPNGGAGSMEPMSVNPGVGNKLTDNTFTRENYTFTGWNTAKDGTGTAYADGEIVNFSADTTLYAQWTQNPVITFDANGGEGTMGTQTVKPNEATALTANSFTRADYDFTGWNTAKDGTGTAYADKANITTNENVTLYAQWTLHKYHVRWLNWNNEVLQEGYYTCEETAAWDDWNNNPPSRPEDENYTYSFASRWTPYDETKGINGWGFNPHEDVDFTAVFNKFKKLTVTFDANGGIGTMDSVKIVNGQSGEYYTLPECGFTREGYTFNGWLITGTVKMSVWDDEEELNDELWRESELLALSNLTLKASWKHSDGWFTDDKGKQYYKDGELQKTGWTVIDGKTYYLDTKTGYAVTGIATLIPDGATVAARCVFDANGVFQSDVTGVYSVGNDTYWLNSGIIEEEAGLKRVVKEDGKVNYYYFAVQKNLEERDGLTLSAAVKSTVLNGKDCWLHKTNGLALPEWGYYFDENGVILHDKDTGKNGIVKDGEDLFYYVDGIKAPAGMIKIGDDYYYANSKGKLIVNQTYYCSRMNGLMKEGTYAFDAEGKLIQGATDKNGIVKDDDGVLRYYVNGKVTYVGLIEIDGDFYYVRSNGEVVNDCVYYISWTHDLKPQGSYRFAADGKLIGAAKNGIVKDDDGVLRYYVNDERTYAGLIQIGDDYYYVNSKCEVVRDCDYYITWTHDLKPQGKYHFDADGKLTGSVAPLKNGIYAEDGSLYYYRNGERTYAGLIQIGDDYYYVNSKYEVVHDCNYYITWTHDLKPQGKYHFDADGKLTGEVAPLKNGIYEEDGSLYFYRNGERTYAGLIQIDGDYYYVRSTCEVVHDRSYYVYWTHGLMPEGYYNFDSAGRMILDSETE